LVEDMMIGDIALVNKAWTPLNFELVIVKTLNVKSLKS
jgi:hypothetical protein